MKNCIKIVFLSGVFMLLLQTGFTQNSCGLYVSTNFNSECILTEYTEHNTGHDLTDESVCFTACQGSSVQYNAEGMTNATYTWQVLGTNNYTVIAGGESIVVDWPANIQNGNVIVKLPLIIQQAIPVLLTDVLR